MDYPGNSSLSPDVRERVLNTYKQTLGLASQGNRQEASLGCDFILRLDPEFEPARTLMTRLEQGDGPVNVEDLQPGGLAFSSSSGVDDGLFDELEHVELDLAPGGEPAGEPSSLKTELRQLLEARRYAEAIQRAQEAGSAATSDPQVQELVRLARSRQEAEPYLQSFLGSARTELRSGNAEQAVRFLESARELDPSHPELRELEPLVASAGQGGAAAAAPQTTTRPPAPSAPAGLDDLGSVDLSAGMDEAAAGASGDDGRIRDLLQEGQAAFEQKDYQGAIDAWSRIFLIDIDHQEAARRIEQARRLKAEHERKLEEIFHEGVGAFEAGDADKARELLEQVLALEPGHLAAQEYLQKIEAGEVPSAAQTASAREGAPAAPVTKAPQTGRAAGGTPTPTLPDLDDEDFGDDVMVPPDPSMTRTAPPTSSPMPETSRSSRTLLLVGVLVLVVVGGGAWLIFQQWESWFPNANEPTELSQDPIRSAAAFHKLGQTDVAIAQLKRLSPGEPYYEEAQALISQWEAEAGAREVSTPEGSGETVSEDGQRRASDPQVQSAQSALVSEARRAMQRSRYFQAESLLLEAQQIGSLDSTGASLLTDVRQQLDPLRSQVAMIRSGEWEYALPDLWRMREEDPSNTDINELLTLSYYNLGVRDLQRGDATSAVSQFEEAANLMEGTDPELERHLSFARSYQGRSKDLLYQIYVKYLPIRR